MDNEQFDFETEAFDPDVSSMMSSLGLSMNDDDVSAVVTDTSSVNDENAPDPYDYSNENKPLVYRTVPKAKKIIVDGKEWWDITDVIGNMEEIAALNTTLAKPKDETIKPAFRDKDGILRRPDRM